MVNRKLSFGVELELANVDCSRDIPEELGSWELGNVKNAAGFYLGREKCVMNSDGTVVDPDKIKCTRGGEIHTVPSYEIDTLLSRVAGIFKLFPEAKMFLPGKMHIHVGIPDWTIDDIKNLYLYTCNNDNDYHLMNAMCSEDWMQEMLDDPALSDKLKEHYLSSRRTINNPLCAKKILDFDTKKELVYWWGARVMYTFPKPEIRFKDIIKPSSQRVRTQSVHIQHLIVHNTIEYRNFAPTMNLNEMKQCMLVAERFTQEALKGLAGAPISDWISEYTLPKWSYEAKYIQPWWDSLSQGISFIRHTNQGKTFHEFTVK